MRGSSSSCTLKPPHTHYDYSRAVAEYEKYGFTVIGEGGFGVIMAYRNCVVKILKNIHRCDELEKEKNIYTILMRHDLSMFPARIPNFSIYEKYESFCLFNSERIASPLSGWGDPFGDDDDEYGSGYVVAATATHYLVSDNDGKRYQIDKDQVTIIDRPGNLIHFYINDMDPYLQTSLEQHQGRLFGLQTLETIFGVANMQKFTYWIGQLLSFIIFTGNIIPFDIEVVLGAKSSQDREIIPYIYDFNECVILDSASYMSDELFTDLVARSLYDKNGRNYFPNSTNVYYQWFRNGFVDGLPVRQGMLAEMVLRKYNNHFHN